MIRPCRKQEIAASEVIGTVLLISIVVIAASIIAVAVFSQTQAQKIPAVSALISNQSQIVYIKHNGGDPLQNGTYRILVDGTDVTSSISLPSTWSIGNTLTYTKPGTTPPSSVVIVYAGSGSAGVVLTSAYFGQYIGGSIPTITGTPTSTAIPTGTTTTATTTVTPTPVSAPVTNFSGAPLTGTIPLMVQFTDLSTNTPTSWAWSFGDGSALSTIQNPSHTYTNAGTYTVMLTTSNSGGSNSTTKTGYIVVTQGQTPASTVYISASKPGDLVSGGYLQFRVTGVSSKITQGGTVHNLNIGDIVELTINSDKQGTSSGSNIVATSSQITTFAFNDVDLTINGIDYGRNTINSIYISSYDTFTSTLTLNVPSQSAWTYFTANNVPIINGLTDSRQITIYNLGMGAGGLQFQPSPIYYTGGATGYTLT